MITAHTTTHNARKSPGVFLVLLLLMLFSLTALIIRFQSGYGKHQHNREPDLAEQGLNTHSAAYAFMEAASGRIHLICTEIEGEFYHVIYKDRGRLDDITAFRVQSYTYRGTTYTLNTVDEYVQFLTRRGDRLLQVSRFTGPFTFVWP